MKKEKNNKKTSLWITIIAAIILVPLLVINLIIIYRANKYPNEVPNIFGYKPLIVMSGSMETSIYTGDLIFAKEVDPSSLKINDIIAFREDDNYITTHRIIEIKEVDGENYFVTKGDNNNTADKHLVSFDKVEGIYLSRIAGLGSVLMFLQKPFGLGVVLLIIFIVGLILFSTAGAVSSKNTVNEEILAELEELRREKEEREKNNK